MTEKIKYYIDSRGEIEYFTSIWPALESYSEWIATEIIEADQDNFEYEECYIWLWLQNEDSGNWGWVLTHSYSEMNVQWNSSDVSAEGYEDYHKEILEQLNEEENAK